MNNHYGMPWHPTDNFAFWNSSQARLELARERFDTIVSALEPTMGKDAAVKLIEDLMTWAAEERESDNIYNNSDC